MAPMYERLEVIYSEMVTKLKEFREELDNLKNVSDVKIESNTTKYSVNDFKTAKQYLYDTDISLRHYGYSMYNTNAQQRNANLKEAIHYYGKNNVEEKLLALIFVWSKKAVTSNDYHLLHRLQVDYAAIKALP